MKAGYRGWFRPVILRPELTGNNGSGGRQARVVSYFWEGIGGHRLLEIGNKILEVTPRVQTCWIWVGGVGGSRSCLRVSDYTWLHTSIGQGVMLKSFLYHSFQKLLNPVLRKNPISFCPIISSLHLPCPRLPFPCLPLAQDNLTLSSLSPGGGGGGSKKGNSPIPIVSKLPCLDLNLMKKAMWFWNHSFLLSFLSLNP